MTASCRLWEMTIVQSKTAAMVRLLAAGIKVEDGRLFGKRGYLPDDRVVVRNRDADEAGDYRIMRHCEAVGDPQWIITDIPPSDLD